MSDIIDKRERAEQFRMRLSQAMQNEGMSQSALARAVGVDRSTISQLLTGSGARLPNAQVVGECAAALGVSSDWLLSISQHPETAANLLAASLSLTAAPRALVDEQIFAWHREAAGYKIRHVPAALPDMMKVTEFLQWEYSPHLGRTMEQAINASEDRLAWMRSSNSDYEIALPLHEMESFARAEGYYRGLPTEVRLAQIERFRELTSSLYPRLRLYLYDARRVFSVPVTVFGPLMAVLYSGRHYIVFRDRERVQALTTDFDVLVREASVTARELPDHLARLRREVAGT
ncbi:DNA binding protein, putative [Pseudooceanicola batsensis HTCC2597]|uniref:DNA binding protein, putative n=1 Tax=Pseudooceanicola batsensis (strain ATCC BAA-863 / DSM 15984 / KCTC 12145 / HTCC2597) TaxID=252305 RepID=A3U1Y5_PSEBH|nr:helix-turn-helix transcriptional regulator [Pseudooceanicola batsensis]EAQ01919.1 DNA binding protein, putative [Pseudooceanicola batsensis HTCC2597]